MKYQSLKPSWACFLVGLTQGLPLSEAGLSITWLCHSCPGVGMCASRILGAEQREELRVFLQEGTLLWTQHTYGF